MAPAAAWPAQLRCSYLNMARWVCSCSSPLMTQEKSPKDSAPVGEGNRLEEDGPSSGQGLRSRKRVFRSQALNQMGLRPPPGNTLIPALPTQGPHSFPLHTHWRIESDHS